VLQTACDVVWEHGPKRGLGCGGEGLSRKTKGLGGKKNMTCETGGGGQVEPKRAHGKRRNFKLPEKLYQSEN